MARKQNKRCLVLNCENSTLSQSNKIFFAILNRLSVRKKSFDAVNCEKLIEVFSFPTNFCEDNFNVSVSIQFYFFKRVMCFLC